MPLHAGPGLKARDGQSVAFLFEGPGKTAKAATSALAPPAGSYLSLLFITFCKASCIPRPANLDWHLHGLYQSQSLSKDVEAIDAAICLMSAQCLLMVHKWCSYL